MDKSKKTSSFDIHGRKVDIIIGTVLCLPIVLTAISFIVYNVQEQESERLWRTPQKSWREVLSPEQRRLLGLDNPLISPDSSSYIPPKDVSERFQEALAVGCEENRLIEKFSRGDFKDYIDYHDGAEGNIGQVDFQDISDYFGGCRD